MNALVQADIRHFTLALLAIALLPLLLAAGWALTFAPRLALMLVLLALATAGALLAVCLLYFRRQEARMEQAIAQLHVMLAGDADARIACDEEGTLFRLFQAVNALASVYAAHLSNETRDKAFLKSTISDISHQLKTPLAALNIYNGLLQADPQDAAAVRELSAWSEKELDRMETLVQNLLKIAKLDAGTLVLDKRRENVADILRDVEMHFACRAQQEQKTLSLSGGDDVCLLCDRVWLTEALSNLVKNALDHTSAGASVRISWRALSGSVQVIIADDGCGIHPEDLPHIFKRFYRSRFSQDHQGLGLGLPLSKAIIEAHHGTIEVDSTPGQGTRFALTFLSPTKL